MNPSRKRRAILCGITEYGARFGKLPQVIKDMEDLGRTLRDGLHEHYRFLEVTTYTDKQVTPNELERILTKEKEDNPVEELLFYLAGHGCMRRNQSYFVTYGTEPSTPGIRLDELSYMLRAIAQPPRVVFAILDFCHAGAFLEELSPLQNVHPLEQSPQMAILAAARATERAEAGKQSFTQYFTEALTKARSDGDITWTAVADYVCKQMKDSLKQRPVMDIAHFVGRAVNYLPPPPKREEGEPELSVVPALSDTAQGRPTAVPRPVAPAPSDTARPPAQIDSYSVDRQKGQELSRKGLEPTKENESPIQVIARVRKLFPKEMSLIFGFALDKHDDFMAIASLATAPGNQ